jgi:hypothetical protein
MPWPSFVHWTSVLIAPWQFGQTLAALLMRLAHVGHFALVVKANANAMGPRKSPNTNHKKPLAPLLLATIAAPMPNRSQMTTNSMACVLSHFQSRFGRLRRQREFSDGIADGDAGESFAPLGFPAAIRERIMI